MKAQERLETPPYFARMEVMNLQDALADGLPDPDRLTAADFQARQASGMLVVDVRRPDAFAGAHVPGAWSLMHELLRHFAGWFLSPERPLGLVVDAVTRNLPIVTFCSTGQRAAIAASLLQQHGYPQVECCLGSMHACQALECPIEEQAA